MNALTDRLLPVRARAVDELADAAAKWDCEVPDDPGVTELADELARAADRIPSDVDGHADVTANLTAAVEHLRAASRLGGLMPLVTCYHLRRALQRHRSAHQALDRSVRSVA